MAFTLNRDGGAEVLKDLAADWVANVAQQVAAKSGDSVVVELRTTDRAKAFVRVPRESQAKDGVLTRAAAEVGLTIYPSKYPKKAKKDAKAARKRGRPRKKKCTQ